MGLLINLNTSASALGGGADAAAGTGEDWKVTVGGTWAAGDKATLTLTDSQTGFQTQVGAGNITGLSPTFCFTYNNKVYMLAGATAYFGELGSGVVFNDPNSAGNEFITFSNFYATQEPLTAVGPYQGKLAFTSRRYTQIWQTDPDPANYAQTQVLANIGTFAPETMQPVGDEDLYMLADTGFRSVRVRDASNNATVADVGNPIDAIVQPLLASLTDVQKAASCGVVEPSSNRYWGYIPNPDGSAGLIYVFSNFRESSIAAWSTYSPTYETVIPTNDGTRAWTGLTIGAGYVWTPGSEVASFQAGSTLFQKGQGGAFVADATTALVFPVDVGAASDGVLTLLTPFVPVKFGVYLGQVWVRDSNGNIYQYGGADNNTYSGCGVSGIVPYLSADQPATRKHFKGVDAAFQGTWMVSVSTDYKTGAYKLIYASSNSSFQSGSIRMGRHATHYSFAFDECSTGYALFSSAVMHFEPEDEK